jgi:6-bladed beta-propeller
MTRANTRFAAFAAVLLITLASTGGVEGQDPTRVRHPALLWEAGSIDGPAELIWQDVNDATVNQYGVFVIDRRLPAVRRFSLSGEYLGDLSKAGQGPGEVVVPWSIRTENEDRVIVMDWAQSRVVTFDASSGGHIETNRLNLPERMRLGDATPMARGWILGQTGYYNIPSGGQRAYFSGIIGGQVDTVATLDGLYLSMKLGRNEHFSSSFSEGAGPSGGVAILTDSTFLLVDGIEAAAWVFRVDDAGFVRGPRLTLPGQASVVTEADRAVFKERIDAIQEGSRFPVREMLYPERWSSWTAVEGTSAEDVVWLRQGGPEAYQRRVERWMRWELSSSEMSWIELPPNTQAIHFSGTYLVAVRTGEFDVRYLQFYRLPEFLHGSGSTPPHLKTAPPTLHKETSLAARRPET